MPQVSRDEVQAMVQRRSGNLKVGVIQAFASGLECRAQLAKHFCSRGIVGQHGDGWKDSGFDVAEMPFGRSGAEGTVVELSHGNRADELIFASDGPDPADEGWRWPGA